MSEISTDKLNQLVLDYLIVHAQRDVAEAFILEAGLPPQDLKNLDTRRKVRQCLLDANVQEAIEEINEWDVYYLESSPETHFRLLNMQLLDLICKADVDVNVESVSPAIEFAKERVLPLIEQQPEDERAKFLKEFQRTMALLCFPKDQLPEDLQKLLSSRPREELAEVINKEMLAKRSRAGTSKLEDLLKACLWTQKRLDSHKLEYSPWEL